MWNADFGIAESLEEMRIVGKLRNAELPLVLSLISSPFRNSATRNLDYFSKSVLVLEWRGLSANSTIRNPRFRCKNCEMWNADFGIAESLEEMRIVGKCEMPNYLLYLA